MLALTTSASVHFKWKAMWSGVRPGIWHCTGVISAVCNEGLPFPMFVLERLIHQIWNTCSDESKIDVKSTLLLFIRSISHSFTTCILIVWLYIQHTGRNGVQTSDAFQLLVAGGRKEPCSVTRTGLPIIPKCFQEIALEYYYCVRSPRTFCLWSPEVSVSTDWMGLHVRNRARDWSYGISVILS